MQRYLRQRATHVRGYSTLARPPAMVHPVRSGDNVYEKTLGNLKVDEKTRVMYQGFTGKQATANAFQSLEYGTLIVGGVSPRKRGAHLGLPLFPTVKEAVKYLKPTATAVFVAAHQAAAAIKDAIEAEIPLVVAVAEHVPVHDMLEISSILKTQSKTRLIGANCPGLINPHTRTRIGFMPYPSFHPGCIGIVAKSGTLSYEAVSSTTRAGLGQSLVLGIGGDWVPGTTLVDGVKVLLEDNLTEGICVIGEIGGNTEVEVAELVKQHKGVKPVMALIGGLTAVEGRVMGHAGAVRGVGDVGAREKIRALEDAGVVMVTDPAHFGPGMLKLLGKRPGVKEVVMGAQNQTRHYHTLRLPWKPLTHTRTLHVQPTHALSLLTEASLCAHELPFPSSPSLPAHLPTFTLSLSIDRTSLSPCFYVSSPTQHITGFTSPYTTSTLSPVASAISTHLNLHGEAKAQLLLVMEVLWSVFCTKEAYSITLASVAVCEDTGLLVGEDIDAVFDDAAFRAAGRQKDVHEVRDVEKEIKEEVEAEKQGIAYVKLPGKDANVGTLVNGAGLSMNTCDVIMHHGGRPANFLDTGGKATKETVMESFRLLLRDDRVKAVLVNIFGGLTMCDVIAEGIVIAFEELGVGVPVVVRLRGTNEEAGRKIIRESMLPLYPFDDLESAVKKVIALADGDDREVS